MHVRRALRLRHRAVPRRVSTVGNASAGALGGLLARRRIAWGRRMSPLVAVRDLKKYFEVRKGVFSRAAGFVHAVDGVSFHIDRSEPLGLVGESGCGKSTAGRT